MASPRTRDQFRLPQEILAAIALGNKLEGVLDCIARAAVRLTRTDMAAITVLADSRDELQVMRVS